MNVVEQIYEKNPTRSEFRHSRSRKPAGFIESVRCASSRGFPGIICEFKRSSPSGFTNSKNTEIVDYFSKLKSERIAAFSVLTEPEYFHGRYEDITSIQDFKIPVLDKDFISTTGMIDNAYNAGADAVLIILDFLGKDRSYELAKYAVSRGLDVLMEFHDLVHLRDLEITGNVTFGYNRRNLRNLKMEPNEEKVKQFMEKEDFPMILESGITPDYLRKNDVSMFEGLLIGASFLENDGILEAIGNLHPS